MGEIVVRAMWFGIGGTSRHPQRFRELAEAREMISELRRKGASFNTIAELATGHGLAVGKTTIADFCHEVLGEAIRPKRRVVSMRKPSASPLVGPSLSALSSGGNPSEILPSATPLQPTPLPLSTPRSKGPRIANIRLAEPIKS